MKLVSMDFVAEFAELLTTALMHFVWQGAVLTLILLGSVKLLDVRTARLRYLLSVGTLLMMGMAPIVTAILHHQADSQPRYSPVGMSGRSGAMIEEHTAAGAIDTTGPVVVDLQGGSATLRNPDIEVYVLIAWLAGVLILGTRLAIGFGVTLWIRGNAKALSDEFDERVRILGDRLGVDARQRVFACVRVGQAVAVGFIRPVVLIPAAWLTELAPQTIEAIIAHELAHIRRWDLWVNLGQRVIETLLFYHPAVWWLSSRIRLEREMCCDEIAAECFDRVLYARSLEAVAKIGQGNLLLAAAISGGKKMKLLNRIRYLFGLAPTDTAGNWWAVGVVAVILPLAAAVAFSFCVAARPSVAKTDNHSTEDHSAESNDSAEPKAIEKIVVAHPQAKAVTVAQQYVCQIQSQRHIDVRAMQTGYLNASAVKEGQAVKVGDVMFEIEPVLYMAKRRAAVAEKNIAQLEFDYTQKLANDKVVSQIEVKLLEAKLARAGANADLAEAELNFTKIRAPFDGIVDRLQDQGSMVQQGDVLATLSDNSLVRVYFNVPETAYLEQMTGLGGPNDDPKVELILASGKKFEQVGKFQAIRADFNSQTGTIAFRADFPNPNHLLRHGQAGTVLISRVVNDAVVVPQRATFELLASRYVFVVDKENVAHRREIVIENESEDDFIIKKGVGVDDKIILQGIQQVHDGEKVEYEDHAQNRG
jgi:membrane fusion protein (multidrug efflux system)